MIDGYKGVNPPVMVGLGVTGVGAGNMWLGRRGILVSIFVVKGDLDKREGEAYGKVSTFPLFPGLLISRLASS